MNRRQLVKKCKIKLLKLRRDYQAILQRKMNPAESRSELIDRASYEVQFRTSAHFRERLYNMIDEIDAALKRIETNSFGLCESTGKEIPANRLLAVPWARVSLR